LLRTALFAAFLLQGIGLPPAPRGYGTSQADIVVDAAGVLSATTVAQLNALAFDLRAKSGGEMAIVTLSDLRGRDVADVALQIGRQWGVGANARIGDRARNAGVVILVVPKETSSDGRGHVRVEVGQGAEGFIPDAVAGDIQREATPFFQRRDYDGALLLIANRVADRFAAEFGFSVDSALAPPPEPPRARMPTGGIPPGVAFLLFLLIFVVLTSSAQRGRGRRSGCGGCLPLLLASQSGYNRRYRSGWGGGWGGGGFGGGSFGGGGGGGFGGFGGGGGFSGGGSSGSW
jgi:uncharacterized protein